MAFRPKNVCGECGWRWHPRGHNRSLLCPGCGSDDVRVVQYSAGCLALTIGPTVLVLLSCCGLIGFAIFHGDKGSTSDRQTEQVSVPARPAHQTVVTVSSAKKTEASGRSEAKTSKEDDERLRKEKADKSKRDAEAEKERQAAREKAKRELDEKDAQTLLLFAKDLISSKKTDAAIERLEKILQKYPNTDAAKEARDLLKKLKM